MDELKIYHARTNSYDAGSNVYVDTGFRRDN